MIEADGAPIVPLTDRRSFLRRAVTALAAGAAVNVTAIVATRPAPAATLPQEDPAIIAMGERIDPLLTAYRNAAEDRLKARACAEAACPAVPEELVCKEADWMGNAEREIDVEGKEILILHHLMNGEPYMAPRRIFDSKQTKAAIERGNLYCDRRTKFGKKVARLIETAEKYETERAAAIERSGLDDAMTRQFEAAYDVERLAFEAFEIEPRTMAGALIQARALNACAETELLIYCRSRSAQLFGNALAKSLTRLSIGGEGGGSHV
jgi:hypothetical protein